MAAERVPFPAGTPPADKAHYPHPQCQQLPQQKVGKNWTHSEAVRTAAVDYSAKRAQFLTSLFALLVPYMNRFFGGKNTGTGPTAHGRCLVRPPMSLSNLAVDKKI